MRLIALSTNPATGQVFYDADGMGGAAQTPFVTITNKPADVYQIDFHIV